MTENAAPILSLASLCKSFGSLVVTDNLNLAIREGEVHALIGPNGAGKTTLLAQIFGELRPDGGRITFAGDDISADPTRKRVRRGMARTYQITSIYPDFTVEDNVAMAVQAASDRPFGIVADARRDGTLREPAKQYLEQVGLSDRAALVAGSLSHGEQRQLELAMALACKPRLLLLDEPMAGLGGGEAREMLELLAALKGSLTMLLVEHDMRAVFALADRISVLVYGKQIATGLPEEIRNNADVRAAYLGES